MKTTVFAICAFTFASVAFAQQPIAATAEDGRKVLLYPDGTWRLVKAGEPSSRSPNVSKEGIIEHTYELIQDYTIDLPPGQGSIRLKRGEKYRGRMLVDRTEIDINGISYSVPRSILYAQPRD